MENLIWEVIDKNGTIHSGSEENMREAFATMIDDFDENLTPSEIKSLKSNWKCDWEGDLKLVAIHLIYA